MANRNSSESRQGDTKANRAGQNQKGSGQQTGGERGQKLNKEDRKDTAAASKNANAVTTAATAKPGLTGMILLGFCLLSHLKF